MDYRKLYKIELISLHCTAVGSQQKNAKVSQQSPMAKARLETSWQEIKFIKN